jgi:hypothetical protein
MASHQNKCQSLRVTAKFTGNLMTIRKTLVQTLAIALTALAAGAAHAQTPPAPAAAPPAAPPPTANACMGLDQAKCPTISGCAWLPGYKVKGGTDVPGYCRTAPKPLTARRPGDPAASAPATKP